MTIKHFFQQKVSVLVFSFVSILPLCAHAGGIMLGGTRVIYPQESQKESVSISNSDEKTTFLVQSWVENSDGQKSKDFVITPPLYTSAPGNENMLRLIRIGEALPTDRESLYYFNAKAIPSLNKAELEGKSSLVLAVVTRIKLFVRPAGLKLLPEAAAAELRFSLGGQKVTIHNPTPYYLTLTDIKVGTTDLGDIMVAPKSKKEMVLPSGTTGDISFSTVNDYGGITSPQKGVMQ